MVLMVGEYATHVPIIYAWEWKGAASNVSVPPLLPFLEMNVQSKHHHAESPLRRQSPNALLWAQYLDSFLAYVCPKQRERDGSPPICLDSPRPVCGPRKKDTEE